MAPRVGVVIIGRNEGGRLLRSLESVIAIRGNPATRSVIDIVYVDSGSTDGSPAAAENLGAGVVHLDMSRPFTAGRARNEGFESLSTRNPDLDYAQFIDGDCSLAQNWIATAVTFLESNPHFAIACGRRAEIAPTDSVFNALCDAEWDTPVGETTESGGDFLIRVRAFRQVGGFNPQLIAGEEPELCYRLRRADWKIMRLDAPMTFHDAAITRFGQWWQRTVRAGYAYAARAALHLDDRSGYCLRENVRIGLWGFLLPLLSILLGAFVHPGWLALLLMYPLQIARLAARYPTTPQLNRWTRATFTVLGKFPEAAGQSKFLTRWALRRQQRIIEYK
jgi:glycosyltransferase involved in cell wall biosynthesis